MTDERKDDPRDDSTSRRKFLTTLGGTLAGALIVRDAEAQISRRVKDLPAIRRPELKKLPDIRVFRPVDNQTKGGDEQALPDYEREKWTPDDVPGFGPIITMAAPGYDVTPAGTMPYLYANRFFEKWDESVPDWFGAAQVGAMGRPTSNWLATTPMPPEWCAVSTVWNEGREAAYGVMMRCLCFAIAPVSATEWQEVTRADLGYLSIGTLSPGDYLEVKYPVSTVRQGMKALDDFMLQEDPKCEQFPRVWYFQKCFAFDPISDPLVLTPPIIAPDPPRKIIGGRHGAGWRWELADQTPGNARTRRFK